MIIARKRSPGRAPTPALSPVGVGLALVGLVALFVGGSYLYVHVAGGLFARAQTLPPALLLALALVGGVASFFSPCSIALTPAFLAYFIGGRSAADGAVSRPRLLRGGVLVALGIVSFYALAGLLIGWLGAVVYNYLIYLLPLVGLVFLVLGYALLSGRSLAALARLNPANRSFEAALGSAARSTRPALYRFGLAYGAASHTCTLPIFLGIVLVPLASGPYWLAGATVLLYGAAIAVLLVVMMLLGQRVVAALRRRLVGHYLTLLTGSLFVLSGLYLLYYFAQNYGAFL